MRLLSLTAVAFYLALTAVTHTVLTRSAPKALQPVKALVANR